MHSAWGGALQSPRHPARAEACRRGLRRRPPCGARPPPRGPGRGALPRRRSGSPEAWAQLSQPSSSVALRLDSIASGCSLTPLHVAAVNGQAEAVRCLLTAKAKVDAKSSSGDTPLHYAATYGRQEVLRPLLVARAAVDIKNKWGLGLRKMGLRSLSGHFSVPVL
eukprot:Skav225937  [mRNA]  locus=scaffold1500:414127:414846:- [translate_table: standard]